MPSKLPRLRDEDPPAPGIARRAEWPISATVLQFRKLSGLGHSKTYELIGDGTLVTFAIGRRRLILIESYLEYLDRLLTGPPGDARRNNMAPLLGSRRAKELGVDGQPLKNPPPGDEGRRDESVSKASRGGSRGRKIRRHDVDVNDRVRHRAFAGAHEDGGRS
jgi:hypothetical protein